MAIASSTGSDVEYDKEGNRCWQIATPLQLLLSSSSMSSCPPRWSWVALSYRSNTSFHPSGRKGIFALDNLWDGLGALTVIDPEIEYFFGKVTMYGTYNKDARNMILYFLNKHFPDKLKLVTPIDPLVTGPNFEKMQQLFHGKSFKDDYKILNKEVRALGYNIPPLINAYMGLSPTMRFFGTAINDDLERWRNRGSSFASTRFWKRRGHATWTPT